MRLLAPRLTAYVAIAGILCLSSTLAIDVATENDIAMPNADVNAAIPDDDFSDLNHGKKHHKHHGSKEKETKLCKRELNLVCDDKVIDKLICKIKTAPAAMAYGLSDVEGSQTPLETPEDATLEALNNGGGNITKVYIFMDKPCSKELPPLCAAALEAAAEEATEAAKDADEADKSEEPQAPDAPAEVDPQGLADEDAEAEADVDLWKKHHHKHGKHYRHRHGNQPHKGHHHHGKHHKDHKHDRHGHSKKKHPWEDLCVAVGAFCGDNLYGCDFDFKTLYACTAVGEKPTILLANAVNCGGTDDGGKCNCKSTAPVCGSSLDPSCKADPNALYHCPNGNGTKYEIFQMCSPGTQCTTDKDGTASCSSDTCHCMGTQQRCSSHFPDKCGLQKNSIYQCSSTGQPEFVSSCGDDKICITHEDGAICRSKDCECTVDGTVCGERFPPACNIVCTGLYDCKTGQAPVLIKNCYPNHCTSSVGSTEASAVFEAADVMDSCSDPCKCTSKGKFCGSTFPISCGFDTTALYSCDGSGSTPIKGEVCKKACLVHAGDNSCASTCQCPITDSGKPVCGGILDPSCKFDPTAIYFCPGGAGSDPHIQRKCLPGTQCNTDNRGNANCGYGSCTCHGDVVACSGQYPADCNLAPNSVYKCGFNGKPELVKTCDPAEDCVSTADGAFCGHKDCKCPDDGTVCGDIFPISCGIVAPALYTCKKGEDPVFQKTCEPGTCSSTTSGNSSNTGDTGNSSNSVFTSAAIDDQCIDNCKCVTKGQVCGSTFSPRCKLEPERIYKCSGPGAEPIPDELCKDKCIVQAGGSTCSGNPGKCKCPIECNGKPACGGTLDPSCKFDPTAIYFCPGGAGSDPQILKKCLPGTQCNTDNSGNANCGYGSCTCHGDVVACSGQYPADCNLAPNSVYKCGFNGKPELVKTCDPAEECVSTADGAHCTNKDCKCPADGTLCGDIFPNSCGIVAPALYSCKKGEDPVFRKICEPGTCSSNTAGNSSNSNPSNSVFTSAAINDQCIDGCKCVAKGEVCGSTFSPSCKLEPEKIYKCSGPGAEPTPDELCKGKCIVQAGGAICSGDPSNCKCPITDSGKPACGRTLDPSCKFDPTAIYYCPGGAGSDPQILKKCLPGTQCNTDNDGNADCGYGSCTCHGDVVACSGQYPADCNLAPNSVYKCGFNGKPELVKTCDPAEDCVSTADRAFCGNKDCKCPDDGTVCGDIFPISCGIVAPALYTCKKGEDPVFQKTCEPGTCSSTTSGNSSNTGDTGNSSNSVFTSAAIDDQCIDNCKCVTKGQVCGSTFSPRCKLEPERIYKCSGPGAEPTPDELCKDKCIVQAGGATCSGNPGKCKCPIECNGKPACGGTLDPSCKFDPTAIYFCPGGAGSDPQILKKCLPGTQCNTDNDGNADCGYGSCTCHGDVVACSGQYPADCNLAPNSVYKCGFNGKPELVKTCDPAEDCVSTADGAFCGNKDCKCPDDGTVCGDIFPILCGIVGPTLYTCNKGEDPIFQRTCEPGTCSYMAANSSGGGGGGSSNSVSVFTSAEIEDQCVDDCKCVTKGEVCGSTFSPRCKHEPERIYKCSGPGAEPTPDELCKDKCIVQAGGSTCSGNPGKCKCPIECNGKPACGGTLDPSCKFDPTAIYFCPGGAGSDPQILKKCLPGTQCNTDNDGNADCGYGSCTCHGDVVACSGQYPADCNLAPNSVYKCGFNGKPELVKTCDPAEECVSTADGAFCGHKDCKCPDDGTVCGDIFPFSCGIVGPALYTCKKGEEPIFQKTCEPGTCSSNTIGNSSNTGNSSTSSQSVFTSAALDNYCTDDCKCVTNGEVCGSTFSPSCKLEPERIYKCSGPGTEPTPDDLCKGKCIVQAGGAICSGDPSNCKCPITDSGKPACGRTLDPSCKFNPTAIYFCPGGAGSDPQILKKCLPGTQCNTDNDGNADCGYGSCTCHGDVVACSGQYPADCNLVPNSVYECGFNGKPELVKTCDPAEDCVSTSDGAFCGHKDCKCPDDGTVCGDIFPFSCGIVAPALYSCKKGEDPVFEKTCEPGTCSSTTSGSSSNAGDTGNSSNSVFTSAALNDHCIDDCKCVTKGQVCGSTFSPRCKLEPERIYKCSGPGAEPTPDELCKGKCIVQAGGATCSGDTSNCKCPITDSGKPACGGTLDPLCKFDPTAIYYCPGGAGSDPQILKKCLPGTQCNTDNDGNADCGYGSCTCHGDVVACSGQYPADCYLVPNSVYECGFNGKPELAKTCDPAEECVSTADGAFCSNKDCKCPDDGTVCGDIFPISCGIVAPALYTCKKGEDPVFEETCEPGTCSFTTGGTSSNTTGNSSNSVFTSASIDDQCIDDCKCVAKGEVCGSTFSPKCKFAPETIYHCDGPGSDPKAGEACKGPCIVQAGGAICSGNPNDECKCKKVGDTCGSAFDPCCGEDKNTLYSCSAVDAMPVLKQVCNGVCLVEGGVAACHCVCTDDGPVCGSAFDPSCGLANNTLYGCNNGSVPVVIKNCDLGTCSANVASNSSNSNPGNSVSFGDDDGIFEAFATSDFCIDQCSCTQANALVCSDTFPAVCHYKKGTLMSCTALNAIPTIAQNCTDGCLVEPGNDMCKPNLCVCQKAGDSCSSNFPANCPFEPNTLYNCSSVGALPVKNVTCTRTEICTVVFGGNDFCGEDSTCTCVGNGTVCGSAFPPNCNKTATSVYTCPAGTETPCPAGCADGACGSTFPPNCGLSATSLYTCVQVGSPPMPLPPMVPTNCTAGCELSIPDNQCVDPPDPPCNQQEATNALTALQAVITSLTSTMAATTADNVSVVDLPVLLQFFSILESNLTSTAPGIGALTQLAGSALNSVNSVFLLLAGALNETLFQNATIYLLAPVIPTLQTGLLSALQALVSCSGSTTKDCTALDQLFNAFTAAALTYVSQFTTPVADQRASNTTAGTATFSAQLTTAAADITASIATVNQTALDASGLLLNRIIGLASNTQYGSASQVMIFAYDAAGYAAACAGLNVTNWQDACNSFGQRTQGFLAGLIGVIQNFLGQLPIVGPYIVDPVLTQLRQLLVDAQTGIATAIGGILSAVEMILSILNIVGGNDSTDQIRNFILGMVGIATPPSQCRQPSGCEGVIMAVKMLINAIYAILDAIPIPMVGPAVVAILQPITNAFLSGLNSATGAVISLAANTLITAIGTVSDMVKNIPFIGSALSTVTDAMDVLVNGAKAILNCYINNPAL
ncbi:hypothetical protein EMPS_03838 [Entomortierella parvispora]|uniref:Uncharacterized protein n=1 Tax=Entomortierella parvispora TaxID=205924 RepID=A0A9P3H805_9FUNG|nr:hypothetical protein EMPS_03838 [Entomortierella parvispora]